MDALRRVFRPEFINRVDSVIVFRALNQEDLNEIVTLELDKLSERLLEHDITLTPTEQAVTLLAELGYDREFGVRPLKRVIQQKIEDILSDALLSGEFKDGDSVLIDVEKTDDEPKIVLRRIDTKEASEEVLAAS